MVDRTRAQVSSQAACRWGRACARRWPMIRRRLKCMVVELGCNYRGRPETVAIDSVLVSVAPSRVPSPYREDAASSSQLRTDLALPESPSSSQLRTALGADAAVSESETARGRQSSLEPSAHAVPCTLARHDLRQPCDHVERRLRMPCCISRRCRRIHACS